MAEQFIAEYRAKIKKWLTEQIVGDIILCVIFVFGVVITRNSQYLYLVIICGIVGLGVSAWKGIKTNFGSFRAFSEHRQLYLDYQSAAQAYETAAAKGNDTEKEKAALDKAERAILDYIQ